MVHCILFYSIKRRWSINIYFAGTKVIIFKINYLVLSLRIAFILVSSANPQLGLHCFVRVSVYKGLKSALQGVYKC